MAKQVKTKKAKYKKGDKLKLVNPWTQQFDSENGLPATIKEVAVDNKGNPVYSVDVQRPPMPAMAQEGELHPIK